MKTEDLILTIAKKVQDKYRMALHAENNKHSTNWHDLYSAQERLRAATIVVEAIESTINEATAIIDG